jgi:hypothetical protein
MCSGFLILLLVISQVPLGKMVADGCFVGRARELGVLGGRRLRAAGQPEQAVTRPQSARQRLIKLAARPHLDACDRELAASAAPAARAEISPTCPG